MDNISSRRLLEFIGREDEISRIGACLASGGTNIVYLEGNAGVGKTCLLEESDRLANELGYCCPPIIDFYDTQTHSHRGLELAIASHIRQISASTFADYEEIKGVRSREVTLDEYERQRWLIFLNDYRKIVADQRILLRFDTAERLEYEQDSLLVRALVQPELDEAPSWSWLLERIGHLPNTCVLIAARPTPEQTLRKQLIAEYGAHVDFLCIENLSLEETEQYFISTEVGKQVASESLVTIEKIHILTRGRPILISLALDWLAKGHWTPALFTSTVDTLRESSEGANGDGQNVAYWQRLIDEFEASLVKTIDDLGGGLDQAIRCAALTRKGCSADMLSLMMDISLPAAKDIIDQLLELSFVKGSRGDSERFFLHDEMYKLIEKYFWNVAYPNYRQQAAIDGQIIEWYSGLIAEIDDSIRVSGSTIERQELRAHQQLLYAEKLYYQLDHDPVTGYREYLKLIDSAIQSKEEQWDIWLRNEALWFFQHRGWRTIPIKRDGQIIYRRLDSREAREYLAVDFDAVRQWVNRYSAHGNYVDAIAVAERALKDSAGDREPPLWRGGVEAGLGAAQAFLGGEHMSSALHNLKSGIERTIRYQGRYGDTWSYQFTLGNAHLALGIARRSLFDLEAAKRSYQQSSKCFREIDYRSGQAEVLNNLAYLYIRQGWVRRATSICAWALALRQELADEWGIGSSLNTRGIIFERRNRPHEAIRDSQGAWRIFEKIGDERGLIMAEINLGRSYRRRARDANWGEWIKDFEQGEENLLRAIRRQEASSGEERYYRIEAQNELGCLYRDWAATIRETRDEEKTEQFDEYLSKAEVHLQKSIELTRVEESQVFRYIVQRIDSAEDLARIDYIRAVNAGSPEQRAKCLNDMKSSLNELEKMISDLGSTRRETLIIQAKLLFEFARYERFQSAESLGIVGRNLGLSAAYAESFSLDAPELHEIVEDTINWLLSLKGETVTTVVKAMKNAIDEENRNRGEQDRLEALRLYHGVIDVVGSVVGVGWPEDEFEFVEEL